MFTRQCGFMRILCEYLCTVEELMKTIKALEMFQSVCVWGADSVNYVISNCSV